MSEGSGSTSAAQEGRPLATEPRPSCLFCGGAGREKYAELADRLFATPGKWRLVECSAGCGVLWLDPMPSARDIALAYGEYYTHTIAPPRASRLRNIYRSIRAGYVARRWGYPRPSPAAVFFGAVFAAFPDLRARFDFSVMWLPAVPGGKLLEIGCGNGDALLSLRAQGWEVQGIDPDPRAVAAACSRGLDVSVGDLFARRYADNAYDAVVLSHVIEHVHDPRALVAECHRILKPGGRLIMLTPNAASRGHRRYGRAWLHLDPPRHLHIFTRDTLQGLTQGLDFSETECFSVIRDANWTLAASRRIRDGGRYVMGRLPWISRLRGYAEMQWEGLLMALDPQAGEEIVLRARKARS